MHTSQSGKPLVGIDDMGVYIPKLTLPIRTLAEERQLDYAKLSKGLGLYHMAVPDAYEDAATMGANAVLQLIENNQLNPRSIGRIYLGTESALDAAKPTATYILEMLRNKLRDQYGPDCFDHCDVIDLTFACIGGVDALHNTLDWVRNDPKRVGIVVTADLAKYDLESSGEYTQGAGSVALLVKQNPRLLVIPDVWGVATKGVHDFFKPRRYLDIPEVREQQLYLQKETPVFDGPYSNQCYQLRMTNAFMHFREQAELLGLLRPEESILSRWHRLIFHLPYALHGRRMFPEIFRLEAIRNGQWPHILERSDLQEPENPTEAEFAEFLRLLSKTPAYRSFADQTMGGAEWTSGQAGNLYACSIFLALAGTLEQALEQAPGLSGNFGFVGYGSGSKSKVFEGVLQPGWQQVAAGIGLRRQLEARQEIAYPVYEALHKGTQKTPVRNPAGEFALKAISSQPNKEGARYYQWA